MRSAILLSAAVAAVLVLHFGRAAVGGHFLADRSAAEDVYHLSVLYERWGAAWRAGHPPIWMDEFAAGYPAPASWMYGLLYPGLALFVVLPAEIAWTWTGLLHIVLGARGVWRLAREHGARSEAAAVGALLFGLSEFLVGRLGCGHLNLVMPAAWAPWILLHAVRTVRGAPGATWRLAVCGALGLVAGHVQIWFYLAPLAAALALAEARWRPGRAVLARLGGAAGGVLLLTAVQWLPAAELVAFSDTTPVPRSVLNVTSAPPLHVLSRLVPGALGWRVEATGLRWHDAPYWPLDGLEHEFLWIGGPWILLLALVALSRPDRTRVFWASAAALGVVLGLGTHLPAAEWINALPPFSLGRTPGRGLVLAVVALPVLAALGAETWFARADGETGGRRVALRRLAPPLLITAVAVAAAALVVDAALRENGDVAYVWPDDAPTDVAELRVRAVLVSTAAALAGVGAVAAALVLGGGGGRRRWLPAVAAGACAWLIALPPVDTVAPDFHRFDWTRAVPEALRSHRLHLHRNRFPPVELRGMRTVRELCHLDTVGFRRLWEPPSGGAAWWLDVATQAIREWDGAVFAPPAGADLDALIDVEVFPTIGPGTLVAFRGTPDAARPDVLAARLQEGTTEAYLERRDAPGSTRHAALPSGAVRRAPGGSPLDLRLDVDAPEPAWLVVSEKHYPGWRATVDGRAAPIVRANLALRAVEVPAGRHAVRFVYRPVSYGLGGAASALTALGLAGGLLRRRRARARAAS